MAEMSSVDVERYVRDANYPANKRDLMDFARRQNAPDNVMRALDMLPDQKFNSSVDVSKSMMGEGSRMGIEFSRESSRRGSR